MTDGGAGAGQALVARFARERPSRIAVVDRDGAAARAVADRVGGSAIVADLTSEAEAARVIRQIEARHGAIDLFCANGGVAAPVEGGKAQHGGRERWHILGVLYHGPGDRLTFLRRVVETPRIGGPGEGDRRLLGPGGRALDPARVADIVVTGLRANRFLVLTRPESKERALLRVTHPDGCPD
ncbi:hypothetical protein GCM10023317_22940 [Actinopolymorpha pittospori]